MLMEAVLTGAHETCAAARLESAMARRKRLEEGVKSKDEEGEEGEDGEKKAKRGSSWRVVLRTCCASPAAEIPCCCSCQAKTGCMRSRTSRCGR